MADAPQTFAEWSAHGTTTAPPAGSLTVYGDNCTSIVAEMTNLRTGCLDLSQFVNSIVDTLQTLGLVQ